MKLIFFCGLAAFFLTSCGSVRYTRYNGSQQDWPVARGAAVQNDLPVAVYHGPPARPYRVIGWVQVDNGWRGAWREERNLHRAADEAKSRGANAIILLDNSRALAGSQAGAGSRRAVIAVELL